MKVGCQQCGAAYSVADEKVAGKKLKLRCKKCGEPIQVDGSAMAQVSAEGQTPASRPPASRPPAQSPAARVQTVKRSPSSSAPAEWHVAVADTTQGPYTLDELAEYYAEGNIVLDTLVYREGWPDWVQAGEVAELQDAANSLSSRPTPPAMSVPAAIASARSALVTRSPIERPIAMGSDPFGEPVVAAASPRVSAEEMFSLGVGHEGTVQFSIDQIRALSAVSAPSLIPAAPIRPGYASGEGSGLIDVASLARAEEESSFQSIVGAEVSPLDTMAPLTLPVAAARGGIDFRTKVFASLAALGLVLIGGVAALAVTRLPPPAPAVAVQPVAAAQPLAAAPSLAAAQPVAAVVQPAAAAPAAVAEDTNAVANTEPDTATVAPKRVAKPKATTDDGERAGKAQRRTGKTASNAHDTERVTKATADKEKPSGGKAASSADIDDLLLAKTPPKEKASAPKKGGSASIDDLLDEAVSAKKPAPKSEAAEPKGDLPATPSRDEMAAAYTKAKAKVQSCKGSGVATAMISIKGSSGRASTVSVTGVEGAAKSCVETAVRSTSFPKFQKDKFDVKLPFKLGA